jgi:hypothetical protein
MAGGSIVEEQFVGRDYRILVVGGQVVAVAERKPASVVGDGRSTVTQLIETVNQDPRRGVGHEQVMTRITVDDHVLEMLARAGLTRAPCRRRVSRSCCAPPPISPPAERRSTAPTRSIPTTPASRAGRR